MCVRRVLVLVASVASASCVDAVEFEMPTPPDMTPVVRAFESPTGNFTADTATEVAQDAFDALGVSVDLGTCGDEGGGCGGPAFLMQALGAIGGGGGETLAQALTAEGVEPETATFAVKIGDRSFDGDGFIKLVRICPGFSGSLLPDAANGRVELTATFSDSGFGGVVWGRADRCAIGAGGVGQRISATVDIHVGDGFTLDGAGGTPILFDVRGSRVFDGDDTGDADELSVRLRIGGGLLEVLVDVAGDALVLSLEDGRVGFRAANGEFGCDDLTEGFASGVCRALSGAAQGQEVAW